MVERLGEVAEGPVVERIDGVLHGGVGGDDDDLHVGITVLGFGQDLEPRISRHIDVRDNQVDRESQEGIHRFPPIVGPSDPVAESLDPPGDQLQHIDFIFSDQHMGFHGEGRPSTHESSCPFWSFRIPSIQTNQASGSRSWSHCQTPSPETGRPGRRRCHRLFGGGGPGSGVSLGDEGCAAEVLVAAGCGASVAGADGVSVAELLPSCVGDTGIGVSAGDPPPSGVAVAATGVSVGALPPSGVAEARTGVSVGDGLPPGVADAAGVPVAVPDPDGVALAGTGVSVAAAGSLVGVALGAALPRLLRRLSWALKPVWADRGARPTMHR